MTDPFTPDNVTGEVVKSWRLHHKIKRQEFQDMCGIGGRSVARLANIEGKDSWKDGDREAVAEVLNALYRGERPASKVQSEATPPAVPVTPAPLPTEPTIFSSTVTDATGPVPPDPEPGYPRGVVDPEPDDEPDDEPSDDRNVREHTEETNAQFESEMNALFGDGGPLSPGGTVADHMDGEPEPVEKPDPFAASKRFLNDVKNQYAAPATCVDPDDDVDETPTAGMLVDEPEPAKRVMVDDSGVEWSVGAHVTDAEAKVAGLTPVPVPVPPHPTKDQFGSLPLADISEFEVEMAANAEPDPAYVAGADANDGAYTVTNSNIQSFKRCKRKWWLAWYRGLAPRHQDLLDVRSTGSRVHKALEAWYVPEGETPVDPRDALERVLTADWTKLVEAAKERGHDDFVMANLKAGFEKSADLERAMVQGYVEWLQETGADANLKIEAAEQSVRVPLFDYMRTDGEVVPVYAMGLLDVRARRTSDGVRLFLDHKTVGSLKEPVQTLPQNEQMLHYHLLEWLSTPDGEERCDGALYNMLRRVKRTAAAKPPFFDRYEVTHSVTELETYKRRLVAESRDVMHTIERLDAGADPQDVVYPSPTKSCTWDCDFFSICSMFDDGSRVEDAISSLYEVVDPNARYEPKSDS